MLTLTLMAGVVPLIVFSTYYTRWMRELTREVQSYKGKMSAVAEETLSNIRTVRAFSNEEGEIKRFDGGNCEVYRVGRKKVLYTAAYSFLTTILLYGSMGAVMVCAVRLYLNDKLTIGSIATFLLYLGQFTLFFGWITQVLGTLGSVFGAADKIVEMMDHEPAIKTTGGDKIKGEIDGRIELKNVKFSYPGRPDV